MNKKKYKAIKKCFSKGYFLGITFCGGVAIILLTVLWLSM